MENLENAKEFEKLSESYSQYEIEEKEVKWTNMEILDIKLSELEDWKLSEIEKIKNQYNLLKKDHRQAKKLIEKSELVFKGDERETLVAETEILLNTFDLEYETHKYAKMTIIVINN